MFHVKPRARGKAVSQVVRLPWRRRVVPGGKRLGRPCPLWRLRVGAGRLGFTRGCVARRSFSRCSLSRGVSKRNPLHLKIGSPVVSSEKVAPHLRGVTWPPAGGPKCQPHHNHEVIRRLYWSDRGLTLMRSRRDGDDIKFVRSGGVTLGLPYWVGDEAERDELLTPGRHPHVRRPRALAPDPSRSNAELVTPLASHTT